MPIGAASQCRIRGASPWLRRAVAGQQRAVAAAEWGKRCPQRPSLCCDLDTCSADAATAVRWPTWAARWGDRPYIKQKGRRGSAALLSSW